MSYNPENVRRIRREYDKRAFSERERADARTAQLRAAIPEIAQIDAIIGSTGLRIMEAASLGDEGLDARMADLREENDILLARRAQILAAHGYAPDYDEVKYACPVCRDTGYVGGRRCECFERELRRAAVEDSGLAGLVGKQTFENFSVSYYNDPASASSVAEALSRFAAAPRGNIFLSGATGLGKTHLSTAVAGKAIDCGYYVIYESAQQIISDFEEKRFRGGDQSRTGRCFDCDLLIIDDLGCEFKTQFVTYVLYDIINTRIASGKSMLISSNLRASKLLEQYGDRVFSRIVGEFEQYTLEGTDIRMQKKRQ